MKSVFLDRVVKILMEGQSLVEITMFPVQIHVQFVFVMKENQSGARQSCVLLPKCLTTKDFLLVNKFLITIFYQIDSQDCKSFRIGSSCCEFICLDNTEVGNDEGSIDVTWGDENWNGGDLGLRLVATAVTAVLSLALLAFLFYRLKRRRVRNHSGNAI